MIQNNRWMMALAAVMIHLSIGGGYAYSVYKLPLMNEMGWSDAHIVIAFTIMMGLAGSSAAIFGTRVERWGPRKSAFIAAILFTMGQAGSGLAVMLDSVVLYWLTYGLLSGLGLGIGYIAPVSTLVKWFPDRRGLATGMAVLGFGCGSLLTAPLASRLMESIGISNTYFLLGAMYFILMSMGSFIIRKPSEGWMPSGFREKVESGQTVVKRDLRQMTAREAVRTKHFWALWTMKLINTCAGLMMISVASPMAQEVVGLTVAGAALMVGVMGIFNGGGRLIWAAASDYIGRPTVYIIFFTIQFVAFFTLPLTTNVFLFVMFILLVVSCYGGGFSNLPAFIGDLFGTKQLGAIHGYLLTTWSLGGVCGPLLVTFIKEATGGYTAVFYTFLAMITFAFMISIWLHRDVAKMRRVMEAKEASGITAAEKTASAV